MSNPSSRHLWQPVTLRQMQRLKNWYQTQRGAHPVEHELWQAVLTAWMMGWMGWLPAYAFDAPWAYPLCVLGMLAPQLYVHLRARAHERLRLRCDWLDLVR